MAAPVLVRLLFGRRSRPNDSDKALAGLQVSAASPKRLAVATLARARRGTTAPHTTIEDALGGGPQVLSLSTAAVTRAVLGRTPGQGGAVDPRLHALLVCGNGLVARRDILRAVPAWTIQTARRANRLIQLLPGVYGDAALIRRANSDLPTLARVERDIARRAVLAYVDGRGALSRLTALDVWGLRRQPPEEAVYLDVPQGSGLRDRPHLLVRRRSGFVVAPPQVVTRGGLPVTRLDRTLVDCWPMLPPIDRSSLLIRAVNDRMTTPQRLAATSAEVPRMPDRAALSGLLDRLAAGCRSPLEIWGHDHVFTGPGMPTFTRQARVRVGARTIYLDLFAEAERVNIELDGATSHGEPAEREIDLRRDALLATIGILVVRFTHRRLTTDPVQVRHETLAILANRTRPSPP